jgi:hypothetical protein
MTIDPDVLAKLTLPPMPNIDGDAPEARQVDLTLDPEPEATEQQPDPTQMAAGRLYIIGNDLLQLSAVLQGPDTELQQKLADDCAGYMGLLAETLTALRAGK